MGSKRAPQCTEEGRDKSLIPANPRRWWRWLLLRSRVGSQRAGKTAGSRSTSPLGLINRVRPASRETKNPGKCHVDDGRDWVEFNRPLYFFDCLIRIPRD